MLTVRQIGGNAKKASVTLKNAGAKKDEALMLFANLLEQNTQRIIEANDIDIENAKKASMTTALIDRLTLTKERVLSMAQGVREVAAMPDPIGRALSGSTLKNGLEVTKVSVPLGVIGIIYEARPNVTSDAASLCLKAGNAVILRGGKEAINSNRAVAQLMREALVKASLDENCVSLIEDTSRESATQLMQLREFVDVLIPRGGKGLIKAVVENSKVPVIETGAGNCHAYVDESADLEMATQIVFNAKTSRPSVCNAVETVLVHKNIAQNALPLIAKKLGEKNVEIRGCERTCAILGASCKQATDEDYYTEYNDYIISAKVVDSIEEAIEHIEKYSSSHSECIVTKDYASAEKFLQGVDSAAVYVNASTRFTDGNEFGLGAEIGISTQKLHARGPMGLNELTTMKYIIRGNGQIRV